MSVNMVVFIIFCAALILVAVFYRNSTLDRLPLLEGEIILSEESGVRVEQGGSSRSVIFIKCIVRITDRRIVIAQKMLLSKRYALRHVIFYNGLSDSTDLKATLARGYLNMVISKSDIKLNETDGVCSVRIDIPQTVLTGKQFILYKTSRREHYQNIL